MPLDVVGKVKLAVSLGLFNTEEEFTVIRNLTVDCLLGADFLKEHGAVMDCRTSTLSIGKKSRYDVPMFMAQQQTKCDSVAVTAPVDMEIPGRTIQLIQGELQGEYDSFCEALVEPTSGAPPTNLCIARTLTPVQSGKEVIVQVMNVSPTPVTIYKGMKLGEAIPRHHVLMVNDGVSEVPSVPTSQLQASDFSLDHSDLSPAEKTQLQDLLTQFADLFAPKGGPVGRTPNVKHSIPTEGRPVRQPLRRIPEALKGAVDAEVTKMLEHGVVQPSSSPWSSPIVMVKKKDGSWRFCVDYRKLNSVTHQDAYPLPRIDATLDSLSGAAYFTTLDLASGYWQVEVEEQDKEKTAFSTPKGHFEFNVMPFGLTNAPATFQRLMECVLAGLTGEQCLIYLDDIVVFSKTFEEHIARLTNVFQALRQADLTLKLSKCDFAQREVKYLGHIVSAAGVRPDPTKIEAVSTYPVPNNVKELRQFLGLANYYRRFVADYSNVAAPLHKLLTKENGFHWDSNCQSAFDELKNRLVSPPILAFPDFKEKFVLYTDASDSAIGGVLSQIQEGKERVIAYWSRQLQKAERNYSTTEKEALAAVAAIKEFYPYLYGFHFTLVTDHNPLTSLRGLKDIGGRLTRWMIYLQQFNFQFEYKPGKSHGNADTMSRRPATENIVTIVHQLEINPDDMSRAQLADENLAPVIKALKEEKPLPTNSAPGLRKAFIRNGLLYRKFQLSSSSSAKTQLVIPSNMKATILQQLHDNNGHLGLRKTTESVKERFYWPGYEQEIEKWVRECQQCQQRNAPQPKPQAPLGTIRANRPFEKVSWDIMGPLPTSSKGKKYILVVTDIFSKWVEAFALHSTDTETLATVLFNEVICRYGVPASLHSDQGANLTSQVISSLCKCLGIDRTQTTAYHPQGNGQVERFNRTLEAMLAKIVKENQRDWDQHIPKVLLAYRTALHESTGYSPYRVNFGRSPSLPVDVMLGTVPLPREGEEKEIPEFVEEINHSLKGVFDDVRQKLNETHRKNKVRHDKKSAGSNLTVGDRVWLYVPAVKQGRTRKLSSLWRGPYTVIDRVGAVTYRIQLIGSPKTLVVHRNRLKLCYGEPGTRRPPAPTPQGREREPTQTSPPATPMKQNRSTLPVPPTPKPTYADVVATRPAAPGGYTTSSNEISTESISQPPDNEYSAVSRPQRNRQPPARYGSYVTH
jgi:transposase InsO family protein